MNLFTRGVVGIGFGAVAGLGLGLASNELRTPDQATIQTHETELRQAEQTLFDTLGNDHCGVVAVQAVTKMTDVFTVKGDVPKAIDEVLEETCPDLPPSIAILARPAYRVVDEAAKQVRADEDMISPKSRRETVALGVATGVLAGWIIGTCPFIGRKQMVKNALIKFAD